MAACSRRQQASPPALMNAWNSNSNAGSFPMRAWSITARVAELRHRTRTLADDVRRMLAALMREAGKRLAHDRDSARTQAEAIQQRLVMEAGSEGAPDEAQRLALQRQYTQLQSQLAGFTRTRLRLQAVLTRHTATISSLLPLLTTCDLNDESALFFAPLNLCACEEIALACARGLEDLLAPQYAVSQSMQRKVLDLLADTVGSMTAGLRGITQTQVDQLGLDRRLLALGEFDRFIALVDRGLNLNLNPRLMEGELSPLQRWTAEDAPVDQRFILCFMQHGLDPSLLSEPDRPSALQQARMVVAGSPLAAHVQPTPYATLMHHSPRSMAQALLSGFQPAVPAGELPLASHVRFCVDLVALWKIVSELIRTRMREALQLLQPRSPELASKDESSQPSAAPTAVQSQAAAERASSAEAAPPAEPAPSPDAASVATPAAARSSSSVDSIISCVGEYLDLEPATTPTQIS